MSFNISFDIFTHQFAVDVNGVTLKYSFDGRTITVEGKVQNVATNVNGQSNVHGSVPSTPATNVSEQPNIPPPVTYVGVTSYIKAVMPRMNDPTILDSKPYLTSDIIPSSEITSSMRNGLAFMNMLHTINPALDGVCIEGLLYLALKDRLTLDPTITEQFNYNSIFNVDMLAEHDGDVNFKGMIADLENVYAIMDPDFKGISEINYSKLNASKFGDKIIDFVMYVATYAYINIEKRGFPTDNYTSTHIFKYCSALLDHIEEFEGLFEYVAGIAKQLMSVDSLVGECKFIPDVPIKEFMTKNYCINGNVDLLAIPVDSGNDQTSKRSAWIYDCKCCKKDDNYRDTDWPRQLNLYAKGLKSAYSIEGLCIVNIFTNRMFRYNVVKGLDSAELD